MTDIFSILSTIGMALMGISLLGGILIIATKRDQFTAAVVSDLVFYSMIGFYLVWSMHNDTQIAYEIVLLAGIVAGILPTMSMARIISKGRR